MFSKQNKIANDRIILSSPRLVSSLPPLEKHHASLRQLPLASVSVEEQHADVTRSTTSRNSQRVNVASRNHFPEHAKTLRYLVLKMRLGLQCPEFEWLGHNHTKGITKADITSLQKLQNVRPCACAGKG